MKLSPTRIGEGVVVGLIVAAVGALIVYCWRRWPPVTGSPM